MNLQKPLLAYLTYPLSNNPKGNGNAVERLAIEIMGKNPNLTVIYAHKSTQFSEKVGEFRSIYGDIQLIKKADLLIMGRPLNYEESSGSVWEYEIAKFFRKPTVTSDYLLGKSESPELWDGQDRRTNKLEKFLEGRLK